jgi:uncharacterized iron-regulated protein
MKKLVKKSAIVLALMVSVFSFTSCEEEVNDVTNNDALYKSILEQYVNSTIIPTYKSLAEAALEMRAANEALKTNPTDESMKKASDAWMKARIWWEKSEAFLFGPVSEDGFDIDGHIDSWPLDLDEIKKSIAAGANITGATAWNLDAEVIGFHVTEYLLYRDGKSRPVSDLTPPELKYLTATTDALVWDCVLAYVAWAGEEHVSEAIKAVFQENSEIVELLNKSSYKNYAAKMKDASGFSNSFASAVSQIAIGAAEIAGEVGATKIEAPYSSRKVEEVESWYSWHSIDDYKNNIESIKNAYLGGVDNTTRTSVSLTTYVASKNKEIDDKIRAAIDDCITQITNIGQGGFSFYEVVRDQKNKEQVELAVDACSKLEELFTGLSAIIE